MMATFKRLSKKPDEGWVRRIARKPLECGALSLFYDFYDNTYCVALCDSRTGTADVLVSSQDLPNLLEEYDFRREHLVDNRNLTAISSPIPNEGEKHETR